MSNELTFISGSFFDCDMPKEKKYLLKYFKTPLEQQFLRYYHCFGNYTHFTDHTGMHCKPRWLMVLKQRLDMLVQLHAKAKKEMDLELLMVIETGQYVLAHGKFERRND